MTLFGQRPQQEAGLTSPHQMGHFEILLSIRSTGPRSVSIGQLCTVALVELFSVRVVAFVNPVPRCKRPVLLSKVCEGSDGIWLVQMWEAFDIHAGIPSPETVTVSHNQDIGTVKQITCKIIHQIHQSWK